MMGKIGSFFKWISGFFKRPPKPIDYDGPAVVATWTETDENGKIYKITKYSNGKEKREPYDASDPSGVDDFLDDIG